MYSNVVFVVAIGRWGVTDPVIHIYKESAYVFYFEIFLRALEGVTRSIMLTCSC
jgi:hypothetical protein